MTKLSINVNKIALLRNSRGRDYPNVVTFAKQFVALGAHGITIHPRQDERHITMQDARNLGQYLDEPGGPELNIEGYPSDEFLSLVESIKPHQCTLVPDGPNQLTSDHGWNLATDMEFVRSSIARLKKLGIRTAIFLDPDPEHVRLVTKTGADRIELYTERYAATFGTPENATIFQQFNNTALLAQELGIEVNAGHDLNLLNLPKFLEIKNILEVSIGHAFIIECIESGMKNVVKNYLDICR